MPGELSLELLFDRMPMGIALMDPQFRILRYNPTWSDFSARYKPPTAAALAPGVGYFEHVPGSETVVMPLLQRALKGEIVHGTGIRLQSADVTSYWDVVLSPLIEDAQVIGILAVAVDVTEQMELRQNLNRLVEERTRELQVLLQVSATANESLQLHELLERTLDLIISLVGAARVGVLLVDDESGELLPYVIRPEQNMFLDDLSPMVTACETVLKSEQALYIAPDLGRGLPEPGALLPLQSRGLPFGVLVVIGAEGSEFTTEKMALFQSIADHLSVAIDNARLFLKNEQAAIAGERNRLARDLHDAVTQTLFSASMIADVLPKIWEKDAEKGRHLLEELRQLTRGALSEMRTLLLELRPAALEDAELGDLIGHQVNAFIARTRIPVIYERHGNGNPPIAVKETCYRIAQETFNNIAKHAEAHLVNVTLTYTPRMLEMRVQDDGIGFDPQDAADEGLGLGIMRERAAQVDAQLEIASQVQGGTLLLLTWQTFIKEENDD